jgi:VIT1/CCC1 family predicted Fe2+/Mn2+ transporter
MVARGRAMLALKKLRHASTADEAKAMIADALPDEVAEAMTPREADGLRSWLAKLPELRHTLPPGAIKGAIAVFLLVTLSTFPVVVPFLVMDNAVRALRVSHATALTMLFLIGWALGKHAGMRPWATGLSMLGIGVVLAAVALALGG